MASIVLQLQADCLDEKIAVTALLRKSLVVSTKLHLTDFKVWCQKEMDGYTYFDSIPEYRRIHGEITVHNPVQGWQPVLFEDSATQKLLSERKLPEPISQLEDLVKSKTAKSIFTLQLSPEILHKVFEREYLELGLIPVIRVKPSHLVRILDAVRKTILQWTLKLEEDSILGEGMVFTPAEQEKALSNANIKIENFQGIIGNVSHSNVSQELSMTVDSGDLKSLSAFLADRGIQEPDLVALREALELDPPSKIKGAFGEKVSAWIGKMVAKAAAGSWEISVGAAGSLLATAISRYYGF
jgi:hypothetical protein